MAFINVMNAKLKFWLPAIIPIFFLVCFFQNCSQGRAETPHTERQVQMTTSEPSIMK